MPSMTAARIWPDESGSARKPDLKREPAWFGADRQPVYCQNVRIARLMTETKTLLEVLRQSADATTVAAIQDLIERGEDYELNRVNALAFAKKRGLDEEKVIAAFLHAARLGIFELSW